MSTVLAIDPGKRCIGWALFRDDVLAECGLIRDPEFSSLQLPTAGKVVIERPQVYPQRVQKGDPNDLIDVALWAGACAVVAQGRTIEFVRPRQWKGTVPKDIHNARVAEKLNDLEASMLAAVKPASLRHNVTDAIGIGLWVLGR